jgi:hypothetical protein
LTITVLAVVTVHPLGAVTVTLYEVEPTVAPDATCVAVVPRVAALVAHWKVDPAMLGVAVKVISVP